MKNIFLILAFLFIATAPVYARIIQAGSTAKEIAVYETATLKQNFEIVGKVMVTAAMPTELVAKIKAAASKRGGDAILLYKVVREGTLPGIGGVGVDGKITAGNDPTATFTAQGAGIGAQDWPIAVGVIVRFVPQGITSISEDTPVPVLE